MELVPILSTIILVGTIATFLLAVFAYIMYKWRERQVHGEGPAIRPIEREPHVLVTPQPPISETPQRPVEAPERVVSEAEERPRRRTRDSLFWEYTDEGFVPVQPRNSAFDETEPAEAATKGGSAWI